MSFGNQQNNNKDMQTSMNTRGIQFSNKYGFDPSSLQFGYWNELISLRIAPALEKSKQTESKVYDYDNTVMTAINIEKAIMLYMALNKYIIPAIENDENKDIAISVGGDSLVCVGTGKRITGEIRPYLAIHKALSDETKKPSLSIHYEFNRNQYISDYNSETGSYELINNVHGELYAFMELLKAAIVGLGNSTAHSNRYVNKYNNDKLTRNIEAIGEKVGAQIEQSGKYSSFRNNKRVDFSSRASSNEQKEDSTTYVAPETINDMSELERFMA